MSQQSRRAALFAVGCVVLVVVSGVAVTGTPAIGGADDSTHDVDIVEESEMVSEESESQLGAGAQLSGLVSTTDTSIRGDVDRQSLRTQLEAAGSPEQRARLLDSQLASTEQRLTELESAFTSLEQDRDAGRINSGRYLAMAATIHEQATAIDGVLDVSEAFVTTVPEDDREPLSERLSRLDERVTQLHDQTASADRAIDGSQSQTGARPLSATAVGNITAESLDAGGIAERVFGSERIDLWVRQADGSTLRVGIVTQDGEVVDLQDGGLENPSVRVYTDYDVVRSIERSDEPATEINRAIEDGRIIYDGGGLGNSLKYGSIDILDSIGDLLWIQVP